MIFSKNSPAVENFSAANRFIIACATVLPISSKPLRNGAVCVEDGKIKAVGAEREIRKLHPEFPVRRFANGTVLPGFVNCHAHLELGWLKTERKFGSFTAWLEHIINKKSSAANTEEIERSVRNGVEELVKSGVTTVGEISSYGCDAEILKKSPMRTVLFREITDSRRGLKPPEKPSDRFEERLFPHSIYSCSPELIKESFRISAENGAPAGIHLAESPEENAFVRGEKNGIEEKVYPIIGKARIARHMSPTPFRYFSEIDDKKTRITAAHMAHVEKDEIEKIRERDIGIALCPRSNEFLDTGTAPVPEYAKLQRVGLGTDGLSSNTTLNFLDEIKAVYRLLLPLGKEKAAEKAVYTATLGGAKALFLEDRIGSIEKGKDADLIFIETGETANPYLSVVSAPSGSKIRTV